MIVLQIYLLGVVLNILLELVYLPVFILADSIHGVTNYRRNARKLGMYWHSFTQRFVNHEVEGQIVYAIFFEIILSWITTLKLIREIYNHIISVVAAPVQRIHELTLPMRSGQNISAEAVWARLFAISVIAATVPIKSEAILSDLEAAGNNAKDFDKNHAIDLLKQLAMPELEQIFQADPGSNYHYSTRIMGLPQDTRR